MFATIDEVRAVCKQKLIDFLRWHDELAQEAKRRGVYRDDTLRDDEELGLTGLGKETYAIRAANIHGMLTALGLDAAERQAFHEECEREVRKEAQTT
ncbi:MAG TPA: hypothetical protein VN495_04255 [Candidatus Paceibacterota bacterium]|nr:hypothetical protein [Candidatus Paceibacterota bacterium]